MRSHFIFCGEDVEDDDYFFIVVWVSHHKEIKMIVMRYLFGSFEHPFWKRVVVGKTRNSSLRDQELRLLPVH